MTAGMLLLKYWRPLALAAAVGVAAWLVWDTATDWRDAAVQAAADAQRVSELEEAVRERDEALKGWQRRAGEWEVAQQAALALQAQQDQELAAARRAAELNRRKYRDAIAKLDAADAACAARPVPAAVDGLLGR